jgi:hypothetical protein
VLSGGWPEEVVRHDEIGRIAVRDALGGSRIAWPEFFDTANKRLAAVKPPMPEFMGDRKALATVRATLVDGNNSGVMMTNDPGLASVELAMANARANVKRDSLKVDFVRLSDAQFLKKALRWCQAHHCWEPVSSSGGKAPSSSRS